MSELTSISDSPDQGIKQLDESPKKKAFLPPVKLELDFELVTEEDIFVGSSPTAAKNTLFTLNSPMNSRRTFGENLSTTTLLQFSWDSLNKAPIHCKYDVKATQTLQEVDSKQIESPSQLKSLGLVKVCWIHNVPVLQPLVIFSGESISIIPVARRRRSVVARTDRRDPVEEFFVLTVQCVKLNSPYIDNIARVDPSALYTKSKEERIPFNKWYSWIERQVASAYINDLFVMPSRT